MRSKALYQKYSTGQHWIKHPTLYAETFAKFLKSKKFKGRMVDIGCGSGRDVDAFSKLGFDILGISKSRQEIRECKNNFPELKFENQNIEKLNFKNNSINAFYMINVIHYVDKEKAVREIFKALSPKGYFFIHFNISIIDKSGKIDYYHDQEDILKLISKFKIIRQKVFERIDSQPTKHRHKILELILQKI